MVSSLQGYEQQLLVPFNQAIQPLLERVPGIEQMVEVIRENIKQPIDRLSMDELASILLFTLRWKTPESSFRYFLNETLRSEVPEQISSWFLYLRLFTHALSKLPSITSRIVYREIKSDETKEYFKGNLILWHEFISCKSSIEYLQPSTNRTDKRTILIIECRPGKDISRYSRERNENEILLSPIRQFEVISSVDCNNQLHLIQLKEIEQNLSPLQISGRTSNIIRPISHLQSIIDQAQPPFKIELIEQNLTDADMDIVRQYAMIDKRCRKLFLATNHITSNGLRILIRGLQNNTTLEYLSLAYNDLSDQGIQPLTDVLALNQSQLKTLSLYGTKMTDRDVQYIADMLKTNTVLTWLHLGQNSITDHGLALLIDVLIDHNQTLKALELSNNKQITDQSIDRLLDMFEHNQSLETLWIKDCQFSPKGKKQLLQSAPSNQRFFLLLV